MKNLDYPRDIGDKSPCTGGRTANYEVPARGIFPAVCLVAAAMLPHAGTEIVDVVEAIRP